MHGENGDFIVSQKGPLTIYTFCSNFAHFAHETPSEKHKTTDEQKSVIVYHPFGVHFRTFLIPFYFSKVGV